MPNLSTLLSNRVAPTRGTEELRLGRVFYRTFNTEYDVNGLGSSFCWTSPGTGTAVIELWGSGGTPGTVCCCYGGGIPGNPGAYSRRTVSVTGTSYVCGFLGCSARSASTCWEGQSGCSVACLFNITASNCLMRSQGGWGGLVLCSTGTAPWCCLIGGGYGYCNTQFSGACGIICNTSSFFGSTTACACGGDTNIDGGISCVIYTDCCGAYYPGSERFAMAIPAGIFSTVAGNQVIVHGDGGCSCYVSGCMTNRRPNYQMALAGLSGSSMGNYSCWSSNTNCSCYNSEGNHPVAPALGGIPAFVCGGGQGYGVRGGHGAVKITFY